MILLFLNFILWLVIGALLLRWIVGGFIDCLKKGSQAPMTSWMGFVVGAVIITIVLLII